MKTQIDKLKNTSLNVQSLLEKLSNTDGFIRLEARESIIAIGKPAVTSIIFALQNSNNDFVKWESAKILCSVIDKKAIYSLVKTLEDNNQDIGWLAAEALILHQKNAWKLLLKELVKKGSDSLLLRNGAHHVFNSQTIEEKYKDLFATLLKALNSVTTTESISVAAYNILTELRVK